MSAKAAPRDSVMARVISRPLPAWRRLLVSLPLIVVVAVGARAGFAWNEGRKLPANLVGTVPFMQETGNIARSLALGKGFSNVFNQGTGATAWLTPVYPLLLAGIFRIFGIFTPASLSWQWL